MRQISVFLTVHEIIKVSNNSVLPTSNNLITHLRWITDLKVLVTVHLRWKIWKIWQFQIFYHEVVTIVRKKQHKIFESKSSFSSVKFVFCYVVFKIRLCFWIDRCSKKVKRTCEIFFLRILDHTMKAFIGRLTCTLWGMVDDGNAATSNFDLYKLIEGILPHAFNAM